MQITAQLLQEAADHVSPSHSIRDGMFEHYMCHAIEQAAARCTSGNHVEKVQVVQLARSLFNDVLRDHEISRAGDLQHPIVFPEGAGCDLTISFQEIQAIRFDFLNLLACSLEN